MTERYTLETIIKATGEKTPLYIKDNTTGITYDLRNCNDLIQFLDQINNKPENTKLNIINDICKINTPIEPNETYDIKSLTEKYILLKHTIQIIQEITTE